MKKYFLKFVFLFIFFYLLLPVISFAATLSWSPASVSARPGGDFEISLFINGDKEKINAVSGVIIYNPADLVLKEIREADSVINFWLERPDVTKSGTVNFSGIIPGGFDAILSPYYAAARPGKILTLIFTSQKAGATAIKLESPEVFLNNPEGRLAELKAISPLEVKVNKTAESNSPVSSIPRDTDPPEIFTPQVGRDQNIFDGQWFVAFSTRDTGSGVARYQIQEHRNLLPDNKNVENWQEVTSPYLLTNQSLNKYISVRAIDRAGNKRVVTLSPPSGTGSYVNKTLWLIIILLCIASLFYYFYSVYSRRRS